ncbi:tyrosine-type recombinase/integrase [uncultured Nostoc sp.]|uniref:tyrosine-type recombinase/integrase n=1 Tax=uncultured Nostoc sp. TaxID=340711 RepID=UPI0035CAF320
MKKQELLNQFILISYLKACGYYLANSGHDTRAIQDYLGHKNIHYTVRYTQISPQRFESFWTD